MATKRTIASNAMTKYSRWALTPVRAGLSHVDSIRFSLLFEKMRHELAAVGGYWGYIFANADAGGVVAHQPGADHGIALIEYRQFSARLVHKSLCAVGAIGARLAPLARKRNVGAFAREERLFDEVGAQVIGR